jgi:hypothetical protein
MTWAESLVFSAGWRHFQRQVSRGGGSVDFAVRTGDPRLQRFVTLVARLPADVGDRIAAAAAQVADHGQYLYPPSDLHLTVVDCSAHLLRGNLDEALGELSVSVRHVLDGVEAPAVHLHGMNLFSASVYVQAWDVDGDVRRLRSRVRRNLHSRPKPRDVVSFVNVVRFQKAVSRAAIAAVARERRTEFGAFALGSVELVLTDRVLSSAGTTVLERYPLRTSGGGG